MCGTWHTHKFMCGTWHMCVTWHICYKIMCVCVWERESVCVHARQIHSCVGDDTLIRGTRLIRMRDMTHSNNDMTNLYVGHDTITCGTLLIPTLGNRNVSTLFRFLETWLIHRQILQRPRCDMGLTYCSVEIWGAFDINGALYHSSGTLLTDMGLFMTALGIFWQNAGLVWYYLGLIDHRALLAEYRPYVSWQNTGLFC